MTQPGEIGELARLMQTFNQATEKLTQSYQKIGDLQRQIAEKDRQLSHKTRLEMLGRMAAALAHEIRNPLGGIQLYASMLRRDLEQDDGKVRTLDRILNAVAGLEKLVEDMLTYGREVEPRKTPQPLGPVVDSALELARAALEEKRIAVVRELDGASADVDAEMMSRVAELQIASWPGDSLTRARSTSFSTVRRRCSSARPTSSSSSSSLNGLMM